jgi:uncharacterized protein YtpQ (UPF0354 family)
VTTPQAQQTAHSATSDYSSDELLERMTTPQIGKETFTLLYVTLLRNQAGSPTVELTADGALHVKPDSGEGSTIYLDNLWIMCRHDPAEAKNAIKRHIAVFGSVRQAASPRLDRIVPMIKDRTYLEFSKSTSGLAFDHLAADLYIVYGEDSELSMKTVARADMEALGLRGPGALAVATENLLRILPEIECHDQGSWPFFTAGGDYAASLLLLDYVWEFARTQVDGDVIAVAPARDSVLFTGAQSIEGLSEIRRVANKIVSSGHHVISATLLRRVNGGWRAFD